MKMKQMESRVLSLLLVILMLVSMIPGSVLATEGTGAGTMNLTLSPEKSTVNPGDAVKVDVVVENNPGITALGVKIDYNPELLTLAGFAMNQEWGGMPTKENDVIAAKAASWITGGEGVALNGTVMTLEFTIAESAANGAVIDVSLRIGECLDTYDEDVACSATPCTLTVTGGSEPVEITSVTLDRTDLTIKENETATLKATVLPENASQAVTWSADEGINVTDGVITPAPGKTGTFTVTAKAGEQTAVCEVTVQHANLQKVGEKPVTCKEDGHPAYWFCDTCQRYYTDDSGAADKETSKAALTIPAGHQYGELIAKVEATCSMNGMKAHYECSRCKKLFDENKDETTKAALTIQATGEHNWGEPDYDWAKTQDGYDCTGTVKCTVCDKQDTVKATVTAEETKTASCMVEGEMTYTATFTGTRFTQQKKTEPIGKAEHKFVKVADAKAATCTADGNKAYWTCSDCHNYFNTEREQINENSWVIKALGHQYGEPAWTWADDNKSATATFTCKREGCDELGDFVKTLTATESSNTLSGEVTKKPTCTEKGTTTYSATVTLKGQDYPDSKTVADIPALGHQYGGPVWTWANDNKSATATFTCTRTGCGHEKPLIVQTSIKETTPATCTEKGTTRYEAKVDFENATYGDEKVVQDIPALGHNFEGQPWQQWIFEEAAEGQYRIKNRFTGKVMDLAMSGVVNGTWVHQWEKTTGKGQRWEIVPADGGKAKIRNVLADKVIDLVGMRVDNGTQAQIWQDVFGENQLWSIQPVPDKLLQKDMPKPEPKKTAPKSTRTQTGTGRAKKTGGKGGRRAAK